MAGWLEGRMAADLVELWVVWKVEKWVVMMVAALVEQMADWLDTPWEQHLAGL